MNSQPQLATRRGSVVMLVVGSLLLSVVLVGFAWITSEPVRERLTGETYLAELPLETQNFEYVTLDTKCDLLDRMSDVELIGIGDSSCLFGLSPEDFEATSGLFAINLGTFGYLGPEGHLRMLRAAMERYQSVRAVLLWLHPHTLAMENSEIAATGYADWLDTRLSGQGGPGLLERVNDTYGGLVRTVILDAAGWRQQPMFEQLTPQIVKQRILEGHGWFRSVAQPTRRSLTVERMDERNLFQLAQVAEFCKQRDVPLYLYVMPVDSVELLPERSQETAAIVQAVSGATLLHGPSQVVEWNRLQSPTHFAGEAAREFSAALGAELRLALGNSP